jgi:hypothetical protein
MKKVHRRSVIDINSSMMSPRVMTSDKHDHVDVITAYLRTEIVNRKSNHTIFWKGDGLSTPPFDPFRRIDDSMETSNLSFDLNCRNAVR